MILNRYILWQFVKTFLFVALIFSLIIQIGHLFDRLPVFVKHQVPLHIIGIYLATMTPLWLVQALPFCTLIAGVNTIGNLARMGELFCLRSSGVSPWRILRPLIFAAFLLTATTFILGNFLMPRSTHLARNLYRHYVDKQGQQNLIWYDIIVLAQGQKRITAKLLNIQKARMETVTVEEYGSNMVLRQSLSAKVAVWSKAKGWMFKDGVLRQFSVNGDEIVQEQPFKNAHIQIAERAQDLAPLQVAPEEMTLAQLKNYIQKLNNLGISSLKETVQYYLKFAFPFTHLLVLAIGIPIAFATTPTGGGQGKKAFSTMRSLSLAIAIAFAYYGLITLGLAMGESRKLPPLLAVWLGNIVFIVIGFFMLRKIK